MESRYEGVLKSEVLFDIDKRLLKLEGEMKSLVSWIDLARREKLDNNEFYKHEHEVLDELKRLRNKIKTLEIMHRHPDAAVHHKEVKQPKVRWTKLGSFWKYFCTLHQLPFDDCCSSCRKELLGE